MLQECSECGAEVRGDIYICPECGAVLQAATVVGPTDFDPSRVLNNRYVLLALLGRGGMGAVWLAKDTQLDEIVAVKMLPMEVAADLRAVEWMKEEVRLARTLRHDNIAAIYSFDLDRDRQTSYIVMEFIDGVDLHALLGSYRKEQKRGLPVGMVLDLLSGMAAAVDYAHSKRVIHRDIKPKNIMVTRDGVVKVTDFGIARRLRETVSKISQTVVAGTPVYMAPEAIEGEKIDPRADIYSLGATVYELLTGEPPFKGAGMDLVYKILKKEVPSVPLEVVGDARVADALTVVLRKCMAKVPQERYSTATEFYNDFESAVSGRVSPEDLTAHKTTLKEDVGTIVAKQRRVVVGPTASVAGTPTAQPVSVQTPSATPQAVPTTPTPPKRRSVLPFIVLSVFVVLVVAAVVWFSLRGGERFRPSDPLESARVAAERGDWELAAAAAKKALQKNPSDPVAEAILKKAERKIKLKRLVSDAILALKEKNWKKARSLAKQALKMEPGNSEAMRIVDEANRAIEFEGKFSSAKGEQARGNLDEAVRLLGEALRLRDDPDAQKLYKELSVRLNRFKELLKKVEKAIAASNAEMAFAALKEARRLWKNAPQLVELMRKIRSIDRRPRLAVVEFEVPKGSVLDGRSAAAAARTSLLLPYRIVDETQTSAMLQTLGLKPSQLDDVVTAAVLWTKRGIRYLLIGSINRVREGFVVTLSLLDLKERRVLRSFSRKCRDASGLQAVCQLAATAISLPSPDQRNLFSDYIGKLEGGDYEGAVEILKKAIGSYPKSDFWKGMVVELGRRLFRKATASARLGRNRQAYRFALLLLNLSPQDNDATALKVALRERLAKASSLFNALKSGNLKEAAEIARQIGKFPENRDWLKRVFEPVLKELMDRVLEAEKKGDKVASAAYARAVLTINPQNREAKKLLWRIGDGFVDSVTLSVARDVSGDRWGKALRTAISSKSRSSFVKQLISLFATRHNYMGKAGHIGGKTGIIYSLSFSPDGATLAVGSSDGCVRLYNPVTRKQKVALKLKSEKAIVDSVAFSPDGRWLAASGTDMLVWVWETATLKEAKSLSWHRGRIQRVAWSPESDFLLSVSWDGTVCVWDVRSGFVRRKVMTIGGLPGVCAWNPTGTLFAVDTAPRNPYAVTVYDAKTYKPKMVLSGHKGYVTALAFSPDGRSLASGGRDGAVIMWDLSSGDKKFLVPFSQNRERKPEVVGLAWDPYGFYLAGSFSDGAVVLWGRRGGGWVEMSRWNCGGEPLRHPVGEVCWSPDGATLAAAVNNRSASLLRTSNSWFAKLKEIRQKAKKLLSSPLTKTVKVGLSDKTLKEVKRRIGDW